jgi:hypothetical protein
MIHFTKGQTEKVILTLKEKQTLSGANFLFYFKSRVTDLSVAFVVLGSSDLSGFKDRYNAFDIVVNSHFANVTSGEFNYWIYQQASTSNLDPALASGLVESGQMSLKNSTEFEYTTYNQTNNTYKVRDI